MHLETLPRILVGTKKGLATNCNTFLPLKYAAATP